MRRRASGLVAAMTVLTLSVAGCTSAATTATTATPSAQATSTSIGGIQISTVSGPGVDRQNLASVFVAVDGLRDGLSGTGLAPYLKQQVQWKACDNGTKCADVLAPLDYDSPGAKAVTISMRMKPATKKPYLGTLFINPGGPGGSGKEEVSSFQTTGLEQYDVVGWDPRGVGDSTAVTCLTDAQADAFLNLDSSPDTDAERVALIKANYEFGKACWERNGDLLNHIGTVETVRDLDLMRQLLGNKKLNFFGYSYGTQIGATYAELFGKSTGRLVLDAAVNITDDDSIIQAQGFDLALGNFAAWCAQYSCGLGSDKQAVLSAVTGFLDRLDSTPLTVGKRKLTQSLAVTGVAMMLYGGKDAWQPLAIILQRGINGDGQYLLGAADQLNSRDANGHYGALFSAFPAISCLDTKEDGVLDADRLWVSDQQKAPIFGKYFGPQYTCTMWPTPPSAYTKLNLTGASAAPLVVIGGTGDNATPYQFAQSMAEQLKSAVLVTYQGEGHGSYGGKSTCIDKLVVSYLAGGKVPTDGTTCS
jgi:pimeloyl-ACP methyl ester carboxylesterase